MCYLFRVVYAFFLQFFHDRNDDMIWYDRVFFSLDLCQPLAEMIHTFISKLCKHFSIESNTVYVQRQTEILIRHGIATFFTYKLCISNNVYHCRRTLRTIEYFVFFVVIGFDNGVHAFFHEIFVHRTFTANFVFVYKTGQSVTFNKRDI